jgi:hypothetical protein
MLNNLDSENILEASRKFVLRQNRIKRLQEDVAIHRGIGAECNHGCPRFWHEIEADKLTISLNLIVEAGE